MLLGIVDRGDRQLELHGMVTNLGDTEQYALVSPTLGTDIWQVEVLEREEIERLGARFTPRDGVTMSEGGVKVSAFLSLGVGALIETIVPGATLLVEPVREVSNAFFPKSIERRAVEVDSTVIGADGSIPEFAESDTSTLNVGKRAPVAGVLGTIDAISEAYVFQNIGDGKFLAHAMSAFARQPELDGEDVSIIYDKNRASVVPKRSIGLFEDFGR